MIKHIIYFLIFLFPALILGQDVNLSFQQIDSKTGLGAGFNEFIYKDSRGFVWISSLGGLYRYDGLEMKVYQPNTDSTGMLGSNIQSPCFEDSVGNIWFSTARAMNCYVRAQDTVFSRQFNDSLGRPINQHYGIFYLESDSIIWTKAGDGIYTYNINSGKENKIIDGIKVMRFAVDTTETGVVKNIIACPWDYGSGFYHLSVDNKEFKDSQFLLKNGYPGISKSSIEVSGALVQNSDSIWLFSPQGLILYQPQKLPKFQHFKLPYPLENSGFRGGALIQNKYLVVGAKNTGLWFFDIKEQHFFKPKTKLDPQLNDILNLRGIYVDQQAHLWISPWDGAQVQHSWLYNNSFSNPFEQLDQRLPVVNSIVEDKEKKIWSATANDGIYVFDQNGIFLKRYQYTVGDFKSIKQLSLSPNGEIWAITDKYLFKYSNEINRFQRVRFTKDPTLFRLLHITPTKKIITTSRGVYEITITSNPSSVVFKASDIIGDKFFPAFQIFQGNEGNIYLPDSKGDLRIYSRNNSSFKATGTLNLNTEIYDVIEDSNDENILWVGSLKGLIKIDIKSSVSSLVFEDREFLSQAKILGITSDDQQNLWLSTNMGLLRYNPSDGSIFSYHIEDGLASQDFSLFANNISKDGKLWLGTNKGIVCFHPDSIEAYPFEPQIAIKNLLINQGEVGKKLSKHIGETSELKLRPGDNSLDFDIVALSSYLPGLNKVYYRLENHDNEWSGLENGEPIQYINLKSGEYNLQLKTENANGLVRNTTIKKVGIEIAPFLYEQTWFWILLSFFFIGITWLGIRIYYGRKLKKQEELAEHKKEIELRELAHQSVIERKELEHSMELERKEFERKQALQNALEVERNRIAAEMHDDLGGGLTSIKLLIKKTFNEVMSEKAFEYLAKVQVYATGAIESMSEIIWAMNSNYDNLDDLLAYIRRYVAEVLDENDIEYQIYIPKELPSLIMSGEKRRNIFLTIKESIHNIVKHAKATSVTLTVQLSNDKVLSVEIKDNGVGINDENRFGNGILNMDLRMKEINATLLLKSETGTGTNIKLRIPLL